MRVEWRVIRSHSSGTGVPGWIGYALVLLGLALFVQVARINGRIALFGRSTQGTVVAFDVSKRTGRRGAPLLEFRTANGECVVFRAFAPDRRRDPYAVGEVCPVRYVESDPSLAEIDTWPSLWRALLAGGLVSAGLIVFIIRRARRRAKSASPSVLTSADPGRDNHPDRVRR